MSTTEIRSLIEAENQRHYARTREIWKSVEGLVSDLQNEFKYHDCLIARLQADLKGSAEKETENFILELCNLFDSHPILSMRDCIFAEECIATHLGNKAFKLLLSKGKLELHHVYKGRPYYTPTWR